MSETGQKRKSRAVRAMSALHAVTDIAGCTRALASLLFQEPCNRGAQFRDAGAVMGRGGQYRRVGGRALSERKRRSYSRELR
jgi:hypothetical protein